MTPGGICDVVREILEVTAMIPSQSHQDQPRLICLKCMSPRTSFRDRRSDVMKSKVQTGLAVINTVIETAYLVSLFIHVLYLYLPILIVHTDNIVPACVL